MNNRRAIGVLYLDFPSTFDKALHNILFSKPKRNGFDGWAVRWIRNWVDGHIQRLVVNGLESQWM